MAKEPELVVKDILTDFFSETASFHSEIQKELQLRSLRNQRYEPEPGRPVANISQTDEPGMNALYGTGKERQTWSMLVPVDDVELTLYGTSMQSQTPDAEGKVGLGFPNSSNPYGYLASRYETSIKTPYDILNGDNTYQNLDDSLKRKVGDVLYTEYPLNSYRPLPGLTSLSVDATQVFTNTAKASIKLFSMSQVDLVMNSMLKLNSQFVMMWGYSSITQDFIKENIYKDGKFQVHSDLRHTIPILSSGRMCYFDTKLGSYDIAFNSDDASFDLSMDFIAMGSAGVGDKNVKERMIEVKNTRKEAEVIVGDPEPVTEGAAQIIQNKDSFKKWINVLEKGGTGETEGISSLVIPDEKMLLEIGSGKETDMISLEEDDTLAQQGFQEDSVVTAGGQEVSKKQRHIDTHFNINHEFDYPTEYNFTNGNNFPKNGKQLAVSVKVSGKDESENSNVDSNTDDMGITYIPWALCEWILNNGIYDTKQGVELLPQKFGQYVPEESYVARDLPAIPAQTQEEANAQNSTNPDAPPMPPHPGSPAVEGHYIVQKVATHLNVLQSCMIPKKKIKYKDQETGTFFPRSQCQYTGNNTGVQFQWEENLVEDGTRLIVSNTITNHRNLFSTNPEVCLLPGQIPQPTDPEIGGLQLKDSNWPSFAVNDDKTLGYLRNILINAEYFFETVYETDLDSVSIVQKIWKDVNKSCGNFWDTIDIGRSDSPGSNDRILTVREKLPKKGLRPTKREMITAIGDYYVYEEDGIEFKYHENSFPIINFGRDSIVRDMNITMQASDALQTQSVYSSDVTKGTKDESPIDAVHRVNTQIEKLKGEDGESEQKTQTISNLEKKKAKLLNELEKSSATFKTYETLLLDSAGRTLSKMKPTGNDYSFQPNIIREAEGKLLKLITVGDRALNSEVLWNGNAVPLPLTATIKLDGISGINQNETCILTYVPAEYNAFKGVFKVVNIKHDLSENGWETELTLKFIAGATTKTDEKE